MCFEFNAQVSQKMKNKKSLKGRHKVVKIKKSDVKNRQNDHSN